jgi:hypothetical protein
MMFSYVIEVEEAGGWVRFVSRRHTGDTDGRPTGFVRSEGGGSIERSGLYAEVCCVPCPMGERRIISSLCTPFHLLAWILMRTVSLGLLKAPAEISPSRYVQLASYPPLSSLGVLGVYNWALLPNRSSLEEMRCPEFR